VGPTVTLLILDRLAGEVIGTAIHIPVANRIAQTAAPTAHRVHGAVIVGVGLPHYESSGI